MSTFNVTSSTLNSNYEYKNGVVVVTGNYSKDAAVQFTTTTTASRATTSATLTATCVMAKSAIHSLKCRAGTPTRYGMLLMRLRST